MAWDMTRSWSSQITDFSKWTKHPSNACCFEQCAGDCGIIRYSTQFFWLKKGIPIKIGSQMAKNDIFKIWTSEQDWSRTWDFISVSHIIFYYMKYRCIPNVARWEKWYPHSPQLRYHFYQHMCDIIFEPITFFFRAVFSGPRTRCFEMFVVFDPSEKL